jgi:hypothetical protein
VTACGDDETQGNTLAPSGGSTNGSTGGGMTSSTTSLSVSSGGGNNASSSSGVGMTCNGCIGDEIAAGAACETAEQACTADTDCAAWEACVFGGCFVQATITPACILACDQAHPNSAALWGALRTCTCNSCNSLCGGFCNPGMGSGGAGGGNGSGGAGGSGGN